MAIRIYTDGSARNNGYENSSGGFGVVIIKVPEHCEDDSNGELIKVVQETAIPTTNNREEMKAIIWALENFGKEQEIPIVYSDSNYSINTFTQWMWSWKQKGWKRGKNKIPENLDLVQYYDKLIQEGYRIELKKVPGHCGLKWNELADMLATGTINQEEAMRKYGC